MTLAPERIGRKPRAESEVVRLDDYRTEADREAIARRRIVKAERRRLALAELARLENVARLWRKERTEG